MARKRAAKPKPAAAPANERVRASRILAKDPGARSLPDKIWLKEYVDKYPGARARDVSRAPAIATAPGGDLRALVHETAPPEGAIGGETWAPVAPPAAPSSEGEPTGAPSAPSDTPVDDGAPAGAPVVDPAPPPPPDAAGAKQIGLFVAGLVWMGAAAVREMAGDSELPDEFKGPLMDPARALKVVAFVSAAAERVALRRDIKPPKHADEATVIAALGASAVAVVANHKRKQRRRPRVPRVEGAPPPRATDDAGEEAPDPKPKPSRELGATLREFSGDQ